MAFKISIKYIETFKKGTSITVIESNQNFDRLCRALYDIKGNCTCYAEETADSHWYWCEIYETMVNRLKHNMY